MPGTGRTYYVAGAGIAGLTLALALAKFGAKVVVLERNPAISEFGAGLQVSPNARKILDNLGLNEALSAHSLEPAGIDVYPYRRAVPLVTMELGAIMRQRFGAPYAVMHRADLADLLYRACRRFANIDILFGVHDWDVVSQAGGVTVTYKADGQSRTGRGDAFIGADGVHSPTRRTLLGGPEAQYGGRTAWRGLMQATAVEGKLPLDRVSVFLSPDRHVVTYPLPHRGQVNVAMFAPEADTAPPPLKHWPHLAAILEAVEDWTPWSLYTVDASRWHSGNIGLVGDAAHAMVPFQAQGAAMGIEDAAVLAPLLIAESNAETAFGKYSQARRSRVARVARISATNGRIFHMRWPLNLARDAVISLQGSRGHLRRLAWLYGHESLFQADPAPVGANRNGG